MAIYKAIQRHLHEKEAFVPETCWIAHVKELSGLSVRQAPNRFHPTRRARPCPPDKIEPIRGALRHFKLVP